MEKTRCIHVAKIARKHGLTDLADSIIKNCDAFVFGEMPAESGDGDDRVSAWCYQLVDLVKKFDYASFEEVTEFVEESRCAFLASIFVMEPFGFTEPQLRRLLATILVDKQLPRLVIECLEDHHGKLWKGTLLTELEHRQCLNLLREVNGCTWWYNFCCRSGSPLNEEERIAIVREVLENTASDCFFGKAMLLLLWSDLCFTSKLCGLFVNLCLALLRRFKAKSLLAMPSSGFIIAVLKERGAFRERVIKEVETTKDKDVATIFLEITLPLTPEQRLGLQELANSLI